MNWGAFSQAEARLGLWRRACVAATMWMTYDSFHWAGAYVLTLGRDAAAITAAGLVIAAVQGPVTLLAGYVFKAYIVGKGGGSDGAAPK